ncbi:MULTISPECIES: IS3 family transposase [Hungatella]|uniref:IS3 family transposase n=1 Tax=Hungatella TaxID=1649459 RepID=UPI002FD7C717
MQNETVYLAIQELSDEKKGKVSQLCGIAGIPRSSCYKWVGREASQRESFNAQLCTQIKDSYEEANGILGYRQMTIKLNRKNEIHINQKRVLRLMRILGLKSVCRAFWGMLKSEMYYLKKFHTYEELTTAIADYIDYYNHRRYQKRLHCMTPMEYREYLQQAA